MKKIILIFVSLILLLSLFYMQFVRGTVVIDAESRYYEMCKELECIWELSHFEICWSNPLCDPLPGQRVCNASIYNILLQRKCSNAFVETNKEYPSNFTFEKSARRCGDMNLYQCEKSYYCDVRAISWNKSCYITQCEDLNVIYWENKYTLKLEEVCNYRDDCALENGRCFLK